MIMASYIFFRCLCPRSLLQDQASKDKALQTVANLSSAQIVSASVMKTQPAFPPPVRVRRESIMDQSSPSPRLIPSHLDSLEVGMSSTDACHPPKIDYLLDVAFFWLLIKDERVFEVVEIYGIRFQNFPENPNDL